MDQHVAPEGNGVEQVLFHPGEVVSADPAAAPAMPVPSAAAPTAPTQHPAAQPAQPQMAADDGDITWTASEFIAHQKSTSWYALLGVVGIVVAAIIWLLTRDWFATTMVVLGIAVLGFYASHKPRQQTYRLDEHGLTIDRRRYGYEQFRSFAVVSEGAFSSIELAPLGRFATYMTIYYAPADEAKIVDVLSAHLPVEPPHNDLTDQLLRRIHF